MKKEDDVRIWEETVTIPTYPVKEPDRNPMFIEKRVNQGTSGRTYPLPVISGLSDEKEDRSYRAVWIENDWVKVMLLPELGGRIQVGEDKTNGYNFFYRQTVIKPALIGLNGPWISGGVEFNWPQHHRPTTFCPVDYWLEEHEDGSKTVWMGEIEPLYRMKGMVGITLHPGKAIVEARVQLFNRTPFPQPFMWWANVAFQSHDETQAFFPTDVHYVTDHARRAMSAFPIARNRYYGVDYSDGTDLTWTKNMVSAGSYFVMKSDYDFFGGYDHARQAGIVYVANHHIAPGKKMFNWGNWEAGHRWQRNLTDSDGEYVELMAGVYTDNQPDFSWMQPYETRQFSQYWYPIQEIGTAQNANLELAVSLKIENGTARIGAASTDWKESCAVVLRKGDQTLFEKRTDLAPNQPFVAETVLPAGTAAHEVTLTVYHSSGAEIIHYTPPVPAEVVIPEPFKPAPWPNEIETNEELYLTGLHLEQYRHPTRDPEPYYEEALRRDPGDARCNNALGLLRMRRGQFAEACQHFQQAVERLTRYNPNPYDGEPSYNLGLALNGLGRRDEAYQAFYKATWNQAWAAAGYFSLAQIDCQRKEWQTALSHLNRSLVYLSQNLSALNLKSAVLRHLGRANEALAQASESRLLDLLDYGARWERWLSLEMSGAKEDAESEQAELKRLMRANPQAYIELSLQYSQAGLFDEAIQVLKQAVYAANTAAQPVFPMVFYLLAQFSEQVGDDEKAAAYGHLAEQAPPDLCFPAKLEEMLALQAAIRRSPQDARAPYYLGNLLYDKQRKSEALALWEQSRELNPQFATVQRNLALAYYNDQKDPTRARQSLETAFRLNPSDARILYELVLLLGQMHVPAADRLALLEANLTTVTLRDDLFLEYVELQNTSGAYSKAAQLIEQRTFHPWEGGEGAVTRNYIWSHLALALNCMASGDNLSALAQIEKALDQPENLGEGRGWGHPQTNLFYYAGKIMQRNGRSDEARAWFEKAYHSHPYRVSEFSFFQGLAALETGRQTEAESIFRGMIKSANQQMNARPQVPYFAASVPLFLSLDEDMEARSSRQCHLLLGLAYAGLGQTEQAHRELDSLLPLSPDANFTTEAVSERL